VHILYCQNSSSVEVPHQISPDTPATVDLVNESDLITFHQLDKKIQDELQRCHIFLISCLRLPENNFCVRPDFKAKPGHKYNEGHFHALDMNRPVDTFHTAMHRIERRTKAVHPTIRSFMIATRRCNEEACNVLIQDLETMKLFHSDFAKIRDTLCSAFKSQHMFADINIQFHEGERITYPHDVIHHEDLLNSLIHLSLSIQGERDLYVHSSSDDVKKYTLKPPHTYISSPCKYMHGVAYPECQKTDRIIAVQSRILFHDNVFKSGGTFYDWTSEQNVRDMRQVYQFVNKFMRSFKLPTFDQLCHVQSYMDY
jgi:hypothetical protein